MTPAEKEQRTLTTLTETEGEALYVPFAKVRELAEQIMCDRHRATKHTLVDCKRWNDKSSVWCISCTTRRALLALGGE